MPFSHILHRVIGIIIGCSKIAFIGASLSEPLLTVRVVNSDGICVYVSYVRS